MLPQRPSDLVVAGTAGRHNKTGESDRGALDGRRAGRRRGDGQVAMGHFGTQSGQIGAPNNSNRWTIKGLENRLTGLTGLIILIPDGWEAGRAVLVGSCQSLGSKATDHIGESLARRRAWDDSGQRRVWKNPRLRDYTAFHSPRRARAEAGPASRDRPAHDTGLGGQSWLITSPAKTRKSTACPGERIGWYVGWANSFLKCVSKSATRSAYGLAATVVVGDWRFSPKIKPLLASTCSRLEKLSSRSSPWLIACRNSLPKPR
jgi:hypothetical protein